jgi:ribosomal protein L11 methyltransferase
VKQPPVTALRVRVRDEDEEIASSLLWEAGTQGLEIRNEAGMSDLLAYFSSPSPLAELRASLAGLAGATAEPASVPDVDWVARFRENFRGFEAGPFWIAPVWDVPDRPGRTIVVDPGRAFGTGTHESTRLCLDALARLAAERDLGRILDVGTGTGILAIAALKLGANRAFGVDLDPESIESARLHAGLNHLSLLLCRGDGALAFRANGFDTVLANLSASVLRGRRRELGHVLAPGGALVLSGLLLDDLNAIRAEFGDLGDLQVLEAGGWAAVVVRCRP